MNELEELDLLARYTLDHLQQMQGIKDAAQRVLDLAEARCQEAEDTHERALDLLASEALKGRPGT